jgi:hypothetical protein
VGLCKLNAADPPGFNHRTYQSDEKTVSSLCFSQMQLVPLQCGLFKWNTMSESGYFPQWVQVLHVCATTLNQAATFGTLLLIARGGGLRAS